MEEGLREREGRECKEEGEGAVWEKMPEGRSLSWIYEAYQVGEVGGGKGHSRQWGPSTHNIWATLTKQKFL